MPRLSTPAVGVASGGRGAWGCTQFFASFSRQQHRISHTFSSFTFSASRTPHAQHPLSSLRTHIPNSEPSVCSALFQHPSTATL